MDIKELEGKKLSDLREIAKSVGIDKPESFKKAELISAIAGGSETKEAKETPTPSNDDKAKRKRTRVEKTDVEQVSLFSEAKKPIVKETVEPKELVEAK